MCPKHPDLSGCGFGANVGVHEEGVGLLAILTQLACGLTFEMVVNDNRAYDNQSCPSSAHSI